MSANIDRNEKPKQCSEVKPGEQVRERRLHCNNTLTMDNHGFSDDK